MKRKKVNLGEFLDSMYGVNLKGKTSWQKDYFFGTISIQLESFKNQDKVFKVLEKNERFLKRFRNWVGGSAE